MSAVAYGKPFFIVVTSSLTRICDTVTITYCLQANGPSPDEALAQHAYDANNSCQLWVYGSDQRIYLASTIASTPLCIDTQGGLLTNGTPLVLSPVKPNKTQQWYLYSSSHPSSYISLVNAPRVVMDGWNDSGRQLAPGRQALICESSNGNGNQIWTLWTSSSLPWPRPVTAQGETGAETRAAQAAEAARAAASSAREALAAAEAAKGFAEQAKTATIARPDAHSPSWIWIPIGVLSLLSFLLALRVH